MENKVRKAAKAGQWYTDNSKKNNERNDIHRSLLSLFFNVSEKIPVHRKSRCAGDDPVFHIRINNQI